MLTQSHEPSPILLTLLSPNFNKSFNFLKILKGTPTHPPTKHIIFLHLHSAPALPLHQVASPCCRQPWASIRWCDPLNFFFSLSSSSPVRHAATQSHVSSIFFSAPLFDLNRLRLVLLIKVRNLLNSLHVIKLRSN